MKKSALYLLSVICLLLFSSCRENAGDVVSITFWHYYHGVQQTALDNLIKEYNADEGLKKGILVEAVSFGGLEDISNAVLSAAGGDKSVSMPELFSSYSDSAYNLVKMNKLADLNNYFSEDELEGYIDYYLEDGRFPNGALYVFPIAKATEIFMLNKTDWDIFQNEVNENPEFSDVSLEMLSTWEGILTASEIYYNWTDSKTEKKNDGKALFGLDNAANFFYAGAVQLGSELFSEDNGSAALDREILKILWDFYYTPMVKGFYGSYGRFRSDDVKTGEILCFTGSTSSVAYFPLQVVHADGESYNIEAFVSPYPSFSDKEKAAVLQGAGICVSKSDTAHEKAAAEFLKWFTEPERNLNFNIDAAGYFPVTGEAMDKLSTVTSEAAPSEGAEKVLNEVYKNSIEQISGHKLYSAPVTEDAAKLRTDLNALNSKAEAARAALLKTVSEEEYAEALSEATGEEAFNEWFASLK